MTNEEQLAKEAAHERIWNDKVQNAIIYNESTGEIFGGEEFLSPDLREKLRHTREFIKEINKH
jgi:hypothetical protein